MPDAVTDLRDLARGLLERREVDAVIGYAATKQPGRTRPVVVTTPDGAGQLVWNRFCVNNLAVYLTRDGIMKKHSKVAVTAKGCDVRSIVALMQERG